MSRKRAKPCCPPSVALPVERPTVIRMPWQMDPRYVIAASTWQFRLVTAGAAGSAPQIPQSGRRVAIGFVIDATLGDRINVSPAPNASFGRFEVGILSTARWFSLAEHGPMVCSEWYIDSAVVQSIGVYEWLLL